MRSHGNQQVKVSPSARILVVDDDPSIRLVIDHALTASGYEIATCDDGSEVMDHLARARFDVVILDLYMPGMNGFEVLRRIREPSTGLLPAPQTPPTVKVLVVSAHSDTATMQFVLKRGADTCLAKPFDLGDLIQAVRQLTVEVPSPSRPRRAR
ncbi:MAG TPA: response regulator [Candidatus Kryptonia bacterium]|nr:response regulator [Candidatus Kryptonia bacterium]